MRYKVIFCSRYFTRPIVFFYTANNTEHAIALFNDDNQILTTIYDEDTRQIADDFYVVHDESFATSSFTFVVGESSKYFNFDLITKVPYEYFGDDPWFAFDKFYKTLRNSAKI
jgi:hypothetical protein